MACELLNGAKETDPGAAINQGGFQDPPLTVLQVPALVLLQGAQKREIIGGHQRLIDILAIVERQAHCERDVLLETSSRSFGRPVLNDRGEVIFAGNGIAAGVGVEEPVLGRVQGRKVFVELPAVAVLEDDVGADRELGKVVDEHDITHVLADEGLYVLVQPGGGRVDEGVHGFGWSGLFSGRRFLLPEQDELDEGSRNSGFFENP